MNCLDHTLTILYVLLLVPWQGIEFGKVVQIKNDYYNGQWKCDETIGINDAKFSMNGLGIYLFGPGCAAKDIYYVGQLENGAFQGYGKLKWSENSDVWKNQEPLWEQNLGEFRGLPFMKQVYKLLLGREVDKAKPFNFEGEFLNNMPHGRGICTFNDEKQASYVTWWREGKLDKYRGTKFEKSPQFFESAHSIDSLMVRDWKKNLFRQKPTYFQMPIYFQVRVMVISLNPSR